jgi:hypothetical protein
VTSKRKPKPASTGFTGLGKFNELYCSSAWSVKSHCVDIIWYFDIHYMSKGYLSKYHNWNIRSKFTSPGSEKYSKRSYRIKVTPKSPTSLPSVPMQLRKEANGCFDMARDPNMSKSSFGYICSSLLV